MSSLLLSANVCGTCRLRVLCPCSCTYRTAPAWSCPNVCLVRLSKLFPHSPLEHSQCSLMCRSSLVITRLAQSCTVPTFHSPFRPLYFPAFRFPPVTPPSPTLLLICQTIARHHQTSIHVLLPEGVYGKSSMGALQTSSANLLRSGHVCDNKSRVVACPPCFTDAN